MPEPQKKTLLLQKITDFIFTFWISCAHYVISIFNTVKPEPIFGISMPINMLVTIYTTQSYGHICACIFESERLLLKTLYFVFANDEAPWKLLNNQAEAAKNTCSLNFFESSRSQCFLFSAFLWHWFALEITSQRMLQRK